MDTLREPLRSSLDPSPLPTHAPMQAGRPPRSPGRASGDGGQGPRVRQSSDSTLHPQPSGRPSSAPSGRSSFDSCADEGPMSDPSRSQRESLDAGPPPPPPPAMPPAGAPTGLDTVPEGRVERSCMSEDLPSITAGFSSGCITTSPFGATASLAPHASGGFFDCTHPGLPPLSPFGDAGVGSQASNSSHARRRSVGKHPANLEHGSTAPPGAIDDLLAVAHSLAQQQAAVQQGQQGTAAPPHTASSSSSGASSSSAGTAAAARFAVPRRQGAAPASSGVAGEPLLSSQVALLAQQLLLHQHQAAASGGGSPAQLRRSLQLQHDAGLAAQQRPLGRSRTVAADELRPAHGAPSAAQLLLSSSGSGAAGGFAALNGGPGPLAARPPLAARFSAPTSPPSEEGSPFSSVQGGIGSWDSGAAQCGGQRGVVPVSCMCTALPNAERSAPPLADARPCPAAPRAARQASTAATCCHPPIRHAWCRPSPRPAWLAGTRGGGRQQPSARRGEAAWAARRGPAGNRPLSHRPRSF